MTEPRGTASPLARVASVRAAGNSAEVGPSSPLDVERQVLLERRGSKSLRAAVATAPKEVRVWAVQHGCTGVDVGSTLDTCLHAFVVHLHGAQASGRHAGSPPSHLLDYLLTLHIHRQCISWCTAGSYASSHRAGGCQALCQLSHTAHCGQKGIAALLSHSCCLQRRRSAAPRH